MKNVIVGVCGGTIEGRQSVVDAISDLTQGRANDITLSSSIRSSTRRGDAMDDAIEGAMGSFLIASIQSFEEAEVIEAYGGEVVHIEGLPSDDIPMTKDSILVTLNKARGRYITPLSAYAKLMERAAA